MKNRVWQSHVRVLWQTLPLALASCVCMALATLPVLQQYAVSPLTVAIILGMLLGNTLWSAVGQWLPEGLLFSKQRLLRLGIVLYGMKITLAQLLYVGWPAFWVDLAMVASTFALALFVGQRLRLPEGLTVLTGAGAAICGAAAVLATQSVAKASERETGVAVATVVVFGTLAMLLYPMLAALIVPHDASVAAWFAWGIYTGASVHEVAQVAAAGAAVNPQVADVAVMTKMIRVMLLAPFLLLLPYVVRWFFRHEKQQHSKMVIPWFALGFVVMVVLNSMVDLPPAWRHNINIFDTFLLTTAMFALGLTTRWQSVKQAGLQPLVLAGVLAVWLLLVGGLLSYGVYWILA